MNKRLLKELQKLYIQQNEKALIDNDYIIYFEEDNINNVSALIKAPYDSVYRHKFVKLVFKIPDNYPHSPPEVFFVNHDDVRIHPNMYENGKCCSTILNTWGDSKYEKWTSSMGIETILLTFHSFLDNHPYTYEPGGGDDPSYTVYVLYQSWTTCLIRYLQYETIPLFQQMIQNYMMVYLDEIFDDLNKLEEEYPFNTYNTRCFEIDNYTINYDRIRKQLLNYYNYINYTENIVDTEHEILDYDAFMNKDYNCNICFDTAIIENSASSVLSCGHSFHKTCLKMHIDNNSNVCPMCRKEITLEEIELVDNTVELVVDAVWMINPVTKRRIKIGSKTWKSLKDEGII